MLNVVYAKIDKEFINQSKNEKSSINHQSKKVLAPSSHQRGTAREQKTNS